MSPADTSRFLCPTSALDLGLKLRRLRRLFWFSLCLAVAAHLALVSTDPFRRVLEKTPRPLTTRFVKREPRLTKPLELRKRPQPKRQMIRRQVQLASARMDQVQASAAFNTRGLISRVAAPNVHMSRRITPHAVQLEPLLHAAQISGARRPENRIDMALALLDVNSMDTGQYRAMVIQDPDDRQAITGFLNFALVLSARSVASGTVGYTSIGVDVIDALVDAVNEYTGLRARFVGQITYDDNRLMDIPIIIPRGAPNQSEMANLARYLLAGGFIYGDVPNWTEVMEKHGGLVNGQDFWIKRLEDDHPVFSSFFDLPGAPSGSGPSGNDKAGTTTWSAVRGYFLHDRMVALSFSKGTGLTMWRNTMDGTRQLQMAVNVIMYALTQEGSITQRLMQIVD